jgi:hypothetical protein
VPVDSPAPSDGAADSLPGADAGLPDADILADMPVTGQVSALAVDLTTDTVYAALVDPQSGQSGGFAVIDDATLTVKATIAPATVDGGAVAPYYYYGRTLAVDATNGLLYAARPFFATVVDVYSLSTNAYASSFDVAALDTKCAGGLGVNAIAVDGARSRLYASCNVPPSTVEIAVIATGATPSLVTGITLSDLQSSQGGLALDTTNQLLFVSNQGQQTPILVDEINTATNAVVSGAQQNLGPGKPVGTLGNTGTAVLVADVPTDAGPDAGYGASTFFSLEPQLLRLPPTFVADSPPTFCPPPFGNAYVEIGHDPVQPGNTLTMTVIVDPTDTTPPSFNIIGLRTALNHEPYNTWTPQEFVSGLHYCYTSGYRYNDSGSNPVAWIIRHLCP